MHFALEEDYGGNPALKINGVRSTLISNQKGMRLMGADDLWYSTMRKPPLAASPFDWKLMVI
jgi:hypothetical protein